MLINAVTLTFPAESADAAAELLRQLRAASLQEPGCHGYDVSRCIDEPRMFVLQRRDGGHVGDDVTFSLCLLLGLPLRLRESP